MVHQEGSSSSKGIHFNIYDDDNHTNTDEAHDGITPDGNCDTYDIPDSNTNHDKNEMNDSNGHANDDNNEVLGSNKHIDNVPIIQDDNNDLELENQDFQNETINSEWPTKIEWDENLSESYVVEDGHTNQTPDLQQIQSIRKGKNTSRDAKRSIEAVVMRLKNCKTPVRMKVVQTVAETVAHSHVTSIHEAVVLDGLFEHMMTMKRGTERGEQLHANYGELFHFIYKIYGEKNEDPEFMWFIACRLKVKNKPRFINSFEKYGKIEILSIVPPPTH